MRNCKIIDGRFRGFVGEVNVHGASGTMYPRLSSLSKEERIREGLFRYETKTEYTEDVPKGTDPKFLKKAGESQNVEEDAFVSTTIYTIATVEDVLAAKLRELTALRWEKQSTRFSYNGVPMPANDVLMNAVTALITTYQEGIQDPSDPVDFKLTEGVWLVLESGAKKSKTRGLDGLREFGTALSSFIQKDCFRKERLFTERLQAMSLEDLIAFDLREEFLSEEE